MVTGGLEGVGEAVTGGLAARAVEPSAGESDSAGPRTCLNCGTLLIGPHCHQCGQPGHVHRTITAWWHDLAHGVLHLDGKIWRTLPLLAWWPGDLTRRYVDGERARFVSPLALFLFSVFLMFAVFSAMGATLVGIGGEPGKDIRVELQQVEREIATLEAQRRERAAQGQSTAAVDEKLRESKAARAVMNTIAGGGTDKMNIGLRTGWERLDKGIEKANANPALLFYKFQANAYKFSWALIPISVPFLWMLFLHRPRYRAFKAYDHLVFVTYSIAAMSLVLIAFVLLRSVGIQGGLLNLILILMPPVHLYRQLRGAYALSRWSALWRTFVLIFFCGVALTLFGLLLLALGVLA